MRNEDHLRATRQATHGGARDLRGGLRDRARGSRPGVSRQPRTYRGRASSTGEEAGGEGSLQSKCGGRESRRHRGAGSAHAPGGPGRRRTVTYRLEHDPESGAFYIRVRDGEYHETIPLEGPGFGAGVDVDAEGNVLGFEFLSFAEYVELIDHAGGSLEVPEQLKRRPTTRTSPP